MELGGKSAAIVCDDADLGIAIPGLVSASMLINGQACAAQTRILVPSHLYDEAAEGFVEAVRALSVGDPLDESTAIGPLVAQRQRARVEAYIASGIAEGARVAFGGGRPAHLDRGWYVEPTVITEANNTMCIAREEIFGPVIVIIPYDGDDEAVRLANDSSYGLSGAVWSADEGRALDIASRVQAGYLTVNGFMVEFNTPLGGVKGSGVGREGGPEGLGEYLEYKTIGIPTPGAQLLRGA